MSGIPVIGIAVLQRHTVLHAACIAWLHFCKELSPFVFAGGALHVLGLVYGGWHTIEVKKQIQRVSMRSRPDWHESEMPGAVGHMAV
jgi:hypothetical protein